MPALKLNSDDEFVLNHCVKHLTRAGDPPAANDQAAAEIFRSSISEAWRFPVVSAMPAKADDPNLNRVTFVYKTRPDDVAPIAVIGTFANLHEALPLKPVSFEGLDTGYRAASFAVPKAQVHFYKYQVGGQFTLDPINPQRATQDNGQQWSRFFTDGYLQPLVLEPWEVQLLYRLIEQILPFRGAAAENFLKRYYFGLNREQRKADLPKAFRLDGSVGEVNAIDKLLAREEAHRLIDYRLCLRQIDRALRAQNPIIDPFEMPAPEYDILYERMAASKLGDGSIPGWDYSAYDNPAYFLYILRRHAVTAAFSHPKYGGNVEAAGWAYLSERFSEPQAASFFDWRPALEPPLGTSSYYS
ncbi:hypothetical protein [Rhizobium leguminosarum]|uniref:hypothetical protein n=1 Tax=Rhizobium leguminosarum TaxID=384 RepID=UPI001C97A2FA|nr:hypothetical protein [Rhizobium leguminosarum]